MSVLVVAAEVLIGMHTETVLAALGFAGVRIASVAHGLQRDGEDAPELAILDADLGSPVFALADALRRHGTSVVFLGVRADLPPEWATAPVVGKPVDRLDLGRIVAPIRQRLARLPQNTS